MGRGTRRRAGRVGGAEGSPAKPKAKEWLLDLIGQAELWHDHERGPYATVLVDGHRENHELGSDAFKNWLAWRAYEVLGASPAAEAIEAALRVAKALALNRGPCCRTWRRVGEHEGRLYLDLGDPRWRAVEIAATGWQVVYAVPVKFLRSRGMEALPELEAGEMIEGLREFVNVESDADFRLLVTWLAAVLRPSGPFPVLVMGGQQGASKSTLARICRRLIDPNASPIRGARAARTARDEARSAAAHGRFRALGYGVRAGLPPLANWIRTEVWPFPIANTAHVIGISLLFGGIAVLDLRLIGARGQALAIASLASLVLPLAGVGFLLAAATGALMFLANPWEYWANPYFSWKLGLIAAAGVNALILHVTSWRGPHAWGQRAPVSARIAGIASLGLWVGVIACGRLMAYF